MKIVKASLDNLNDLSEMFHSYRELSVSYTGDSNLLETKRWINERLVADDTVFFLAFLEDVAVGFAILYPSFSSISLKRIYVFNDLYVVEEHRNKGIGKQLMNRVHVYAKETESKGLELETAHSNKNAQRLYESLGYKEIELYKRYFWSAETAQ